MDCSGSRQVQRQDGIYLNRLVIGESAAQLIHHGSGEDIRPCLGELHTAAVVGQRAIHPRCQRHRSAVDRQGPAYLVVPQVFGGHLDDHRLIRVGELRQFEGELHRIPDQDGLLCRSELAAKGVGNAGIDEVCASFGEAQRSSIVAQGVRHLSPIFRDDRPLYLKAIQVIPFQPNICGTVNMDILRGDDFQLNDRIDFDGDVRGILLAQFIQNRSCEHIAAVACLRKIELATVIAELYGNLFPIAGHGPRHRGRSSLLHGQCDVSRLVLVQFGRVCHQADIEVFDDMDRDLIGRVLTPSLVRCLCHERVVARLSEADVGQIRHIDSGIISAILLNFPGNGLAVREVLSIQIQGQCLIQMESALIRLSRKLDSRKNLNRLLL